jgi:proteasome lid subunit RPN8/RPN11
MRLGRYFEDTIKRSTLTANKNASPAVCREKSSRVTFRLMAEIRLAQEVAAELLSEARSDPSAECCGLLAGQGGSITQVFTAHNAAENPTTAYEIAPPELFQLMGKIREAGLELLGIYHSHPNSDNQPSARDIERAYYPDAAYFILSVHTNAPDPIRAFSIRDGHRIELRIQIV